MCGKIELPVLTLTGWEVGALSYFSYSITTQKQDNKKQSTKELKDALNLMLKK